MQGHLLGAATVRRRFGKSNRQENDCCREALPCKFPLEFDLPLRSGPKGQPKTHSATGQSINQRRTSYATRSLKTNKHTARPVEATKTGRL